MHYAGKSEKVCQHDYVTQEEEEEEEEEED
jgi:hypothetical protein